LTGTLLISVSQVPRITRLCHQCLLCLGLLWH
jgi:hypothetical protein